MSKTTHLFVGWGYDSSSCAYCHIDAYDPAIQHARLHGGGEFCEDTPVEQQAWEEWERTKPERIKAALDKVRSVLTKDEYYLLNLRYFGEYEG